MPVASAIGLDVREACLSLLVFLLVVLRRPSVVLCAPVSICGVNEAHLFVFAAITLISLCQQSRCLISECVLLVSHIAIYFCHIRECCSVIVFVLFFMKVHLM